ncbi:LPS assembly lipoprotein LptE [Marinospirillum perlucidum]|uniref:LPS-assembly lipoprotein LptE n=1 Tax=Marinospirillum perlucidum TaxID=1982602 RepID=UPI000DF2E583|nr:LPS assembly lipoprotein LptE [Marinospirillum perlucidum]
MLKLWQKQAGFGPLLLLLVLGLLAGCGFQLRGYLTLPDHLQPLKVEADSSAGSLATALERQLNQSGVATTDSSQAAAVTIRLKDLRSGERQLVFGQVEEHELELLVTASARDRDGESLFSNEDFSTRSQYTYDSENDSLLARDRLRDDLKQRMQSNLLRQLTLRIKSLEATSAPEDAATSAQAASDAP